MVCCPPVAATGSTLCNPSHTQTGLLYGRQHSTTTSICGSRMILKCHAGSCHKWIYAGSPGPGLGVELLYSAHKNSTVMKPRQRGGLGPKTDQNIKEDTNNLHSKQYFPEHRSPVHLCNRIAVLCVKQKLSMNRGYHSHTQQKIG